MNHKDSKTRLEQQWKQLEIEQKAQKEKKDIVENQK